MRPRCCCQAPTKRHAPGFTMIEMLITVALFGVAMTVLVAGLRTGAGTWRAIQERQTESAREQSGYDTLRGDIARLFLNPNIGAAILEERNDDRGDAVTFTVRGSRQAQDEGRGAVWSRVVYRVDDDPDEGAILRREETRYAGQFAFEEDPLTRTILTGIRTARFDYQAQDDTTETWDSEDALPSAIVIELTPEAGPKVTETIIVPMGILARRVGF